MVVVVDVVVVVVLVLVVVVVVLVVVLVLVDVVLGGMVVSGVSDGISEVVVVVGSGVLIVVVVSVPGVGGEGCVSAVSLASSVLEHPDNRSATTIAVARIVFTCISPCGVCGVVMWLAGLTTCGCLTASQAIIYEMESNSLASREV